MSSSLYSTLPDTSETSFAREMSDMQSEVYNVVSLYCNMNIPIYI